MIEYGEYKGRPGYLVRGKRLKALFLPEDGGKLVSLKHGEKELLAEAPGREYLRLGLCSDYVFTECSGFDDMFPTIDPYTVPDGPYRGKQYLDHGEVCRVSMEAERTENSLCLHTCLQDFPVSFRKTVSVTDSGAIAIDYELQNLGAYDFPYIWAAHCMIAACEDGRVIHPFSESAPVKAMFGKLLSRVETQPFSADGESYKYYFTQPVPEGYCGYRYGDGSTLMLRYPGDAVPYLGIWINNGSFKGMYNIALEPCTAPYDRPDKAKMAGCDSVLPAHSHTSFRLLLDMEETAND